MVVEIPLADVREAVRQVARGTAYQQIRSIAKDRIALAVEKVARPIIDAEIERQLPGAVRAVVSDELERLIKAEWRRVRAGGKLDDQARLLLKSAGGQDG